LEVKAQDIILAVANNIYSLKTLPELLKNIMSNSFEQNNKESNQIKPFSSKPDSNTFQQISTEMVNFLRGEKYVHFTV